MLCDRCGTPLVGMMCLDCGRTLQKIQAAQYTRLEHYDARSRDRRNGPCPCGSGKKFKKCCMRAEVNAETEDQPVVAAVEGKQNAD